MKKYPLTIYGYESKQMAIWNCPEYIRKLIIKAKIDNYIPKNEGINIKLKINKDPNGFKYYDLDINLILKQRLRKLFFDFFKFK